MAVRDGRRLSFAEYGSPRGPAIVWMHGTPGARRQIPFEARAYAEQHGLRIIGIDRPGIGSSTPHLYPEPGCPAAGRTSWPRERRSPSGCRASACSAAWPRCWARTRPRVA